jgi:hypothetical protein
VHGGIGVGVLAVDGHHALLGAERPDRRARHGGQDITHPRLRGELDVEPVGSGTVAQTCE